MQKLTKQFVLAADEVWRLQGGFDPKVYRERGGADPECIAFQDMAGDGHYGPGAGSKQGIYVCTPSGDLLASINSSRPRNVAKMLERGLAKWRELSVKAKGVPAKSAKPTHRFEWSCPKDGLRLTSTMRYLPANQDPKSRRKTEYNHDFLWFSRKEARQFLPKKVSVGAKHTLPELLFQRISRLNIVDAVRGETRPFRKAEGSITTEVTAVQGDVVVLRVTGSTKAEGRPRRPGLYMPDGIKSQLLGEARFDREKGEFLSFELIAKGVSWMHPRRFAGAARRAQVRNIGWYFTLTPKREDGFYVSPTHLSSYGVPWSRRIRR